jgi:hypothetical protein
MGKKRVHIPADVIVQRREDERRTAEEAGKKLEQLSSTAAAI